MGNVSIWDKRVSSESVQGESHVFFRYAGKNNFEKEKLRRIKNQSSDILQDSQNRPTGDRWLKL